MTGAVTGHHVSRTSRITPWTNVQIASQVLEGLYIASYVSKVLAGQPIYRAGIPGLAPGAKPDHLAIADGEIRMIQASRTTHAEIARRLADTAGVQKALKRAALEAIRDHAQSGHKIVVWRNNQIVWEEPTLPSETLNPEA